MIRVILQLKDFHCLPFVIYINETHFVYAELTTLTN